MNVIANGLAVQRSGAVPERQSGDVRHFTRVGVVAIVLWQSQHRADAIISADGCSQMRGLAVEFITVIKYSIFARSPMNKPVLEVFDAQLIPQPLYCSAGFAVEITLGGFMSTTDWLTLALVAITAFYAWATFEILRANKAVVQAMQAQTEAQLRPYVVARVTVQLGTTLLLLQIENTGKSPALDLRLRMDKDFFFNGEKGRDNLSKLPVFTQPIESLSPGARIPFVLGVGHTIFAKEIDESICPKVFTITAEYLFGGKTYAERNTIDLRPLLHSTADHDPVGNEVKKLRESLEKLLRK